MSSVRAVRAGAGFAGAFSIVAVLTPAFDGLADGSFAWHMVQHLVVMLAGVPLLLLGMYGAKWQQFLSKSTIATLARLARTGAVRLLLWPPIGWASMAAVLFYTHFSVLYSLALEHPAVHALEHALYVGAAVLFWLPVIGNAAQPALSYPARLLYLFLALPQGALLAIALLAERTALYAPYVAKLGVAGALADQQNAAAVMWIGGGGATFVALMIVAAAWAVREYAPAVPA
jgi:putative membrane protein